jgi:3-isopropylmalate/(R)-2-methylmalate dehydratase small subunit
MTIICAKVWKFGHDINTDIIIPACHLVLPIEEMKYYAMAPIDSTFARKFKKGDVIVAGKNFGCGSSREQAPAILKALGVKAIIATGFARIFFRNAINLGLFVIECERFHDHVDDGDMVEIDFALSHISLPERQMSFSGSKLPEFMLNILNVGGLLPYLSIKEDRH